jgi:nucleoside diphosphate kinase
LQGDKLIQLLLACRFGRTLIGATNPLASAPGTIRGDYGIEVGRNIIHGSDSTEVSGAHA